MNVPTSYAYWHTVNLTHLNAELIEAFPNDPWTPPLWNAWSSTYLVATLSISISPFTPALPNDPIFMKLQPSSFDDVDLLEHRLSETDGTPSSSVVDGGGGVTEVFVITWFWTTVWIEGDGVTDTEVDSGDVSELAAAVLALAVPVVLKIKKQQLLMSNGQSTNPEN